MAGSIAITYEEQDEVLKKGHRNGAHKYKANFQAGRIIYGNIP
jgi:acetyl-CoA acetyltransferase